MTRKNRHVADAGAIALAASLLFSGVLVAGSAQAAPAVSVTAKTTSSQSPVITYVALGDSYAAGQGAAPYDNACLQSDLGYPDTLDAVKHVKQIADGSCRGATTADVVTKQLSVIKKNKEIDLVTVTVGGNDLNVAAVAAACLVSSESPQCQEALAAAYVLLSPPPEGGPSPLAVSLTGTFSAIAAAAPGATILATGYPYLFETPELGDPNFATIVKLNEATRLVNFTIQSVVAQLALAGVDIRFVDVTDEFAGHGIGINVTEPWIVSSGTDAFHPNELGYRAYAAAIEAEL